MNHCQLDDIRCRPLNRSVHSNALSGSLHHFIGSQQLRHRPPPLEICGNIAVDLCPFNNAFHKCIYAGKLVLIVPDIAVGLLHGNVNILRQRIGAHAVQNAEIHRLGRAPHFRRDHLPWHAKHLRSRCGMNIRAAQKGLLHLFVSAEVGQQPQFNLAVVRIQQNASFLCHKELSHIPSQFCPHRNILEIGFRGGNAPCPGFRLFENRVDTSVCSHCFQKAVYIGGFQLGILPPFQHIRHNGKFTAEFFQNLRIGGIAGLGLFPVGQLHFLKQDIAQLLRRADIKRMAGFIVDHLLHFFYLFRQIHAKILNALLINGDSGMLHCGQHYSQLFLCMQERSHFLIVYPFFHRLIQRRKRHQIRMHALALFKRHMIGHTQVLNFIGRSGRIQQIRRNFRITCRRRAAVRCHPGRQQKPILGFCCKGNPRLLKQNLTQSRIFCTVNRFRI